MQQPTKFERVINPDGAQPDRAITGLTRADEVIECPRRRPNSKVRIGEKPLVSTQLTISG